MNKKKAAVEDINERMKGLSTSFEGISEKEAEKRLLYYGANTIAENPQNYPLKFLGEFIGPIPFMLFALIGLSIFLKDYTEAFIVIGLLIFNAVATFFEEFKADNTLELLKKKLAAYVNVKRGGTWKRVASQSLVPGDIIRIRLGDICQADGLITESDYLSVDQSMLTGESLPVEKRRGEDIFSSSLVKAGEATVLVTATGKKTSFGKTAELVKMAKSRTHLEADIINLIKYLVVADIGLIAVVLIFSFISGINLIDTVSFSLLILLASVPVAISAAFTIAMAYGAKRLSSRDILVTKLGAIEEAATMDLVCLDKTGTMTMNKLAVLDPWPYLRNTKEEVLLYGSLASRAEDNDEIDTAIIRECLDHKIKTPVFKVKRFFPFDPATKISRSEVEINNKLIKAAKGFPSEIIRLCNIKNEESREIEEKIRSSSSNGERVIAVAANKNGVWDLIGLLPLADRLRPDTRKLISELNRLGLTTKMLTGDNIDTARAVAKEAKIGDKMISADSLAGKSEKEIAGLVAENDGFAGVFPKDKYTIVKALQDSGFHVGMTGDGVNDAPALKQAEVGIAVSNATDVAKSAAAIVLTAGGIEPIVNAIKESRAIFERMMTYTLNKVTRIFQIAFFLSVAFIVLKFLPLLPIQLILMIFINDIGSISLSTDEESYSKGPDNWDTKTILHASLIFAVMATIEIALLSIIGLSYLHLGESAFQTFLFVSFIFSIEMMLLSIRSRHGFLSSMPSAPVLLQIISAVLITAFIAYFGILMTSLRAEYLILPAIFAVIFLVLTDAIKVFIYGRYHEFAKL